MATIFIDGFESGNFLGNGAQDVWTGGAGLPLANTTSPRTGTYCLAIDSATEYATVPFSRHGNGVSNPTTISGVVYIRTSASTSNRVNCLSFYNGTNHFGIALDGLQLYIYAGSGTTSNAVSVGGTLSTATWYRVDYKCDASTGTWSYAAQVNGGTEASTTASLTSTAFTTVYAGQYEANAPGATVLLDDIIVTNSTADYPIGDSKVLSMWLTSDGSHNTGSGVWTDHLSNALNDSTTTAYTFMDTRPPVRSGGHVRQTGNDITSYMECNFENISITGFTVDSVYAYTWVQNSSPTGSTPQRAYVYDGNGAAALSPDVVLSTFDPGASVLARSHFITAPGGGWTQTVMDALKWRIGHGDGAPDNYHFEVFLQVALLASATDAQAWVSWAELEVPNPNSSARVSWAEFETPDASTDRAAYVSFAELEVPTPNAQAWISWAELEVPTLDAYARISWAELEVPNPSAAAWVSWAELEVPTWDRAAMVSWAEFRVPTPRTGITDTDSVEGWIHPNWRWIPPLQRMKRNKAGQWRIRR